MKQAFLFFSALILGLALQAQTRGSFGLKAGANIYTITGDDFGDNTSSKIGFHGGVFYRLPIATMLYLQPEALYSAEGIKSKEAEASANLSLNYLNVPLMLQLAAPGGFFVETGPQVGFLLSAKTKFTLGGQSEEEDIKEDLNAVAFSWSAGAGYMFGNVGLGARYNLGLTRLPKEGNDGNNKSNGFQISLIWRLPK